MKIVKSEVRKIDLSRYVNHITRDDHKKIFLEPPGKNHYALLAYLSIHLKGNNIVELGTHHGTSSLALSVCPDNRITTFDIRDQYGINLQPRNVQRCIGNIFDLELAYLLLYADLIFLDTSHTGEFEKKVYEYLIKNDYKGLLLLDDIHWNKEMQSFWNSITTTKYDITDIGHGECPAGPQNNTIAGTGIVDFTGNLQIID